MSKENVSVTVDPDVAQYLDRPGVNTSGKINDLLKQEMNAGTSEKQMLELRQEQLEGEIESLESQLETKKKGLKNVQQRLGELDNEKEKQYEDDLRGVKKVPDDPETGYVQKIAEKYDMKPEKVLKESKKL